MVLKNRSNEIRSNEIRIRQELPVFQFLNIIWMVFPFPVVKKWNIVYKIIMY